jgi:hypothetical protein
MHSRSDARHDLRPLIQRPTALHPQPATHTEIFMSTMTAQEVQPPALAETLAQPLAPIPAAAQQAPQAVEITPVVLIAKALDRGMSLDQLGMLFDLQKRMDAEVRMQAYNDDFAAFKAEAVEIIKRKRVHFESRKEGGHTTDYKHAELADVVEAVGPALSRHGFSWSWSIDQKEVQGQIKVTCTLKHRRGHSESVWMYGPPDNSGNKNPVQAITSTVTMLERQTLKAVTGVSEKGDDNDGRGAPGQPQDQSASQQEREAESAQLRTAGEAAATQGTAALNAWWGSLTGRQRNAMTKEFGAMRRTAMTANADANQKGGAR